jgi:hypothetical protein
MLPCGQVTLRYYAILVSKLINFYFSNGASSNPGTCGYHFQSAYPLCHRAESFFRFSDDVATRRDAKSISRRRPGSPHQQEGVVRKGVLAVGQQGKQSVRDVLAAEFKNLFKYSKIN